MGLNGIFLGGLAKRQDEQARIEQQGTALGQGQQGLDLRKQEQQFNQAQAEVQKRQQSVEKDVQQLSLLARSANTPEKKQAVSQVAETMLQAYTGSQFQQDGSSESNARLIQNALSTPTAEEEALQTGQLAGTAQTAKQQSIAGSGLSPAQQEAAGGAKVRTTKDPDQFEPVFDSTGNIVGQKNIKTGKVESDPRSIAAAAQFEPITDEAGNIVAQKNIQTGKVESDPRASKENALKPNQRKAATFALRMQDASAIIDELGAAFTGTADRLSGLTPQGLKSSEKQRVETAERNFVNAILREESGSAIGPQEFSSAELQYFPRPGDGEEVLIQKKRNRDVVIQGLKSEAGEAFEQLEASLPPLTVDVGGQQIAVGSIITNGRGQRGRVEQDGSIMVLD